MNQNRKRMTLPIDKDFNRKSLKNKNLMSENTDEKIDFSKSIISQCKKLQKVKKGTSMILCFYRLEVETFKEKHKIIDDPLLSPKTHCRASLQRETQSPQQLAT